MLTPDSNAFAFRFESLNRRPAQRAMLVAVFGFMAVLSAGTMAMAARSGTLWAWVGFRLVVGELLVVWLAADHVTATLTRARKSGEWDEWRLIPKAAENIARELVSTTRRFIWVGLGIWGIVEAGIAGWLVLQGGMHWMILCLVPVFFTIHAPTAGLAASAFLLEFASNRGAMFSTWLKGGLRTMANLMKHMAFVAGAASFFAVVVLLSTAEPGVFVPVIAVPAMASLAALVMYLRWEMTNFETRAAAKVLRRILKADTE